jgi:hypothetical protein
MKKKFSWFAVGNMVGLIGGLIVILNYFYNICIKPFIESKLIGITPFGFIILILAFIVCGTNFNYFDEKLSK